MNPDNVTTLLLDYSFLPYRFISARTAFLHLLKNDIRSFDAGGDLYDSFEDWNNSKIQLHKDQPYLRSKNKIWHIPTVAAIKTKFFAKKKIPKNVSLQKMCVVFDFVCQICLQQKERSELTLEHIFPKSLGGSNEIENITITCKKCNFQKKDIYPFLNKNGEDIRTLPMPIRFLPNNKMSPRPEWNKFFIY